MSWARLAIVGLKLLVALVGWLQQKRLVRAAEDKIIAQQATALLNATKHGRELRNRVKGLSDEEADRLWDDILS